MRSQLAFWLVLLFMAGCFAPDLSARTAPDTYWVQFTDKEGTPFSLAEPEAFLSPRAIARREAQHISYDEKDLPVDPAYVAAVQATGAQVLNTSKWFNAVTIRVVDESMLTAIQALPFVAIVRATRSALVASPREDKFRSLPSMELRGGGPADPGPSFTQTAMLSGHELHALGAQGQGMLIGLLDSGFQGVDSSAAFAAVRARNGFVLTRDLVTHDGDVFDDHWHGRSVLSTMAGVLDGQLLGTAPEADYVLLRTEDADTEYLVEEDNWISGAELADSLGCDVLNTSLGYTTFDDSTMDHTIDQLDGHTVRMSIAASIASQKGMVPVFSAGNRGDDEWHYISVPADAVDVLTVGAVGEMEDHASFSSFGPSADGRVKPDVCAMGWGTTILRSDADSITFANGTSFASPIVAGLVACLWQLHPERTAQQIMDAVRRSASFFSAPNDSLGYGVPDLAAAHAWLQLTASVPEEPRSATTVWPVPFQQQLHVHDVRLREGASYYALFDANGRASDLRRTQVDGNGGMIATVSELLPPGPYLLKVMQGELVMYLRVMRAP
ncbi:MAG: S8 family serine peptidase [Flavobacteriales bacterium]|nr:S8 family serine peptidase [Flavobacteriales bacterium]